MGSASTFGVLDLRNVQFSISSVTSSNAAFPNGAGASVTIREVPESAAGASAVPEPAARVLLATAALGGLAFRRRCRYR